MWLATHQTLDSRVAVKLLTPSGKAKEAQSRFLFEARAAARLNNPHIVHLSDFGVHEDKPFLVMELLEGETLAARLAREGSLSPLVTARILAQVSRGVTAAHDAGIVHRDLKPENVFLVDSGHELLVKVLDFGVAKALTSATSARTQTGMTIGTLPYMSPEQIADSKRVDARADVWSFAILAFECLTGRRPFEAENVASLVYAICHKSAPVPSSVGPVPAGFDDWFTRASARNLAERWASLADASAELSRVCGAPASDNAPAPRTLPTQIPTDATSPVERTDAPVSSEPRRAKRSRFHGMAAALVLIVIGLAMWITLTQDSSGPEATPVTETETLHSNPAREPVAAPPSKTIAELTTDPATAAATGPSSIRAPHAEPPQITLDGSPARRPPELSRPTLKTVPSAAPTPSSRPAKSKKSTERTNEAPLFL